MDYSVPILTELVLVSADIERTLKAAASVSVEQFQVLARLKAEEKRITPSALSRALLLPPSSIATALKALKSVGAVSAKEDPEDRRLQLISISEVGTMLLLASDKALEALVARIWQPLSNSEQSMKHWGSAQTMSRYNLIRVEKGHIDAAAAYCDAAILSLRGTRALLARHALSANDYRIMKTAIDTASDGSFPHVGDIGKALVMSSSLMAQTVRSLERRDLMRRYVSSTDARAKLLTPTEEGAAVLAKARRELLRTMRKDFTPMSRDTVDEYGRIAEKVVDVYRKSAHLS